jgi:hypothetical protein
VKAARCGSVVAACCLLACCSAAVCGSWWAGVDQRASHSRSAGWLAGRVEEMLRRLKGRQRDQSRTTPSGAAGPGAVVGSCKKAQLSEPRRRIGLDLVDDVALTCARTRNRNTLSRLWPWWMGGRRRGSGGGVGVGGDSIEMAGWASGYRSMVLASRSGW